MANEKIYVDLSLNKLIFIPWHVWNFRLNLVYVLDSTWQAYWCHKLEFVQTCSKCEAWRGYNDVKINLDLSTRIKNKIEQIMFVELSKLKSEHVKQCLLVRLSYAMCMHLILVKYKHLEETLWTFEDLTMFKALFHKNLQGGVCTWLYEISTSCDSNRVY